MEDGARVYAQQYGVSLEQARKVLETQSHAPGLEEALRDALGEGFGGLELVAEDPSWKVWLAPGADKARAQAVLSQRGVDEQSFGSTRWAATTREEAVAALTERLAAAVEADDVRIVSTPQKGVVVRTYATTPRGVRQAAANAVAARSGVASVESRQVAPKFHATACGAQFCDAPLVAGVRYWGSPNSCTIAFSAAAAGGNFNLTAGHCTYVPNWPNAGATRYTCNAAVTWCGAIGWDIGGYWSTAGDGGLVQLSSYSNYPGFRVYGWAYSTYAVLGTQNAAIGMYLCGTGTSSMRTTCGRVYSLTAPAGGRGGAAMIGVDGACGIHGDSGGPLFDPSTGRAVGMLSGSYAIDSCVPTRTTWEPVTRAAATLGVSVKTL